MVVAEDIPPAADQVEDMLAAKAVDTLPVEAWEAVTPLAAALVAVPVVDTPPEAAWAVATHRVDNPMAVAPAVVDTPPAVEWAADTPVAKVADMLKVKHPISSLPDST